jgi:hypothetical protein
MAQRLSAEQRRALAVLAASGQIGFTDQLMMAHGFTFDLLANLIRAGLATATLRRKQVGVRMIEVAKVRITDAGRQTLSD